MSELRHLLLSESLVMLDFANDSGIHSPPAIARQLQQIAERETEAAPDPILAGEVGLLTDIHNQLAELILPATPRTVLALKVDGESQAMFRFGGTVRLVLYMRVVVVLSLICLVGFSLFDVVDGTHEEMSITQNHGLSLMLNFVFLLSAASMGACFSALFTANEYIKDGTFDDTYESTYWTRYILGLIAGMLLGIIIPVDAIIQNAGSGAETTTAGPVVSGEPPTGSTAQTVPSGDNDSLPRGMGAPLLALLGGFSASFVYRVLDKLVKVMETTVQGDAESEIAAREAQAQARLSERANRNNLKQAALLSDLQKQLADGASGEDLSKALATMQQRLMQEEEPRL